MTGTIISLHGDQHDAVNALLPWYATDTLDADERARVEAHLADCPACQAELASERSLKALFADTAAVGDTDRGFAKLMADIDAAPAAPRATIARQWAASPAWMRWAVAAQLMLLVGGGLWLGLSSKPQAQPQYHALASRDQPRPGNVVVVFRPDARESEVRGALKAAHARLVDGPTEADAYILAVPPQARDTALKTLHADKAVVVAEPLDSGDGR
ncbi:zf-HC2 domain-containing protein [Asticcacaulis solisilvae]|uniref:zf-HC2 domain-containing protein n=1 Tax=Asticcacaulis solisilvae TaxID=1217274 RepID=UPI003FD836A2